MRVLVKFTGLLAALALVPALASAQVIEEKHILSGRAKLDPALGYVFIQSPTRTAGLFLREPDEATRAEYQHDWEQAYTQARARYERAYTSWERNAEQARSAGTRVPPRPVEVTRETFSIGAIALRNAFSFGPQYVYTKSDTLFTYLNAVRPGTYIYYGPVMNLSVQPAGTCYCMGTVKFEVKAGQITDLGNALLALPVPTMPYSIGTQAMMAQNEERAAGGRDPVWTRPALTFGVPASLSAFPAVQAELHASGKLNNYYGLPIDRMPPIPGILAYRRDTVIDERTGADIPTPAIVTQVRIRQ